MKILIFYCRGERWEVDEKGQIKSNGLNVHSSTWIFKGVSFHHWKNSLDMDLKACFENPSKMKFGLVWDLDHGTLRQWGGRYCDKLPRVTHAYTEIV